MNVIYSGFLKDSSGFGEAARRNILALQTTDIDLRPGTVLTDGVSLQVLPLRIQEFLSRPTHEEPDVHLIHAFARDFGILPKRAPRTIGLSCWETDRLPESYLEGCKQVDHVIVPCRQNISIFEKSGTPVSMIPYPIVPEYDMTPIPQVEELKSGHVVFYTMGTWQKRKNIEAAITAVYTGSYISKIPVLFLIIIGGNELGAKFANNEISYLINALNLPDAEVKLLILHSLSDGQIHWIHKISDCYISMSHGEGFALPILDACAFGKYIIAPDWGGHVDILSREDHMPRFGIHFVPTRFIPVTQAYPLFSGLHLWADPDILNAQHAVINFLSDRDLKNSRYIRDMSNYDLETVGSQLAGVIRGD